MNRYNYIDGEKRIDFYAKYPIGRRWTLKPGGKLFSEIKDIHVMYSLSLPYIMPNFEWVGMRIDVSQYSLFGTLEKYLGKVTGFSVEILEENFE